MSKNYLVVKRRNSKENWSVEFDNLDSKGHASRMARKLRKDYPNDQIQVWVDIITTKVIKKF